MVDPALEIGGIQKHIGELHVGEGSRTECSSCSSSSLQIRLTSDLEMPDSRPSAATRSSTFLVETPCT